MSSLNQYKCILLPTWVSIFRSHRERTREARRILFRILLFPSYCLCFLLTSFSDVFFPPRILAVGRIGEAKHWTAHGYVNKPLQLLSQSSVQALRPCSHIYLQ